MKAKNRIKKVINYTTTNVNRQLLKYIKFNALVEGKNGSVVRKILGYAHIPQF